MTQHREPTRLLVAVAAAIPQGLILAADGKNARRELVEMSCNPEEWSSLGDTMPKEPGFYVWEGQFVGEDGVGAGELGGQGDCDVWWEGEWRVAGLRDLLSFNFVHGSPKCPRHDIEKERDERGHLQCSECMADLGRRSAALRAAETRPGWDKRNEERARLIQRAHGTGRPLDERELARLAELNEEADGYVSASLRPQIEALAGCGECGAFLYPDGRDAQGRAHPQVHRDGNQHVPPALRADYDAAQGEGASANGCEWCHGPTTRVGPGLVCVEKCEGSQAAVVRVCDLVRENCNNEGRADEKESQ